MTERDDGRVVSDTIYALSSGGPPSGVAIIRLSGPSVRFVLETISGKVPRPRQARLASLRDPATGDLLDTALVLFFPTPHSFTGEDVGELQVHGGRAVIEACLSALSRLPGCRLAEAGEFTRRAFDNGRIDLTEAEGLADLIAAETETQRRQALGAAGGALADKAGLWRSALIEARAAIEADFDFAEEDDIPDSIAGRAKSIVEALADDIRTVLRDAERGERVREGFEVVLMGQPNAGKSSLLNAIARREVAIVTSIPGTTRDILEVHLDLDGCAVTLVDTAGLRPAVDEIEAEGIRRGRKRGALADLILWLSDDDADVPEDIRALGVPVLRVATKSDLRTPSGSCDITVSIHDRRALAGLISAIAARARAAMGTEPALVAHERQRLCLQAALGAIEAAARGNLPAEVVADHLRAAGDAMSRLIGRIDVEDVLGDIFARFCVGK